MTQDSIRPFDACLLDYGNTITEFDRKQIDYVRIHLTNALSRLVEPARLSRVSDSLDTVCSLPYLGSPPDYREVTPYEQMDRLLRLVYGEDREFAEELVRECDAVLQDLFVQSITVDEGTRFFLERLRERMPVGLVSNYPCGVSLRRSLRKNGLDAVLSPIVISGEVGYVKPHESVFRAALDALPAPASRVLFVGDRWDADMVGAAGMGMKTCHHVGYTSDLDLDDRYAIYRPDFQIELLEEIEAILFDGSAFESPRSEAGELR